MTTDYTLLPPNSTALERANATLEKRVRDRTEELTRLNSELGRAKAEADARQPGKLREKDEFMRDD